MLTRVEELRLIAQCALADDRDAFGRLVEAYQPRVRRFFLNLTGGDTMLTDDLAQETFIKAYVNLRGFRGMAGFGTSTRLHDGLMYIIVVVAGALFLIHGKIGVGDYTAYLLYDRQEPPAPRQAAPGGSDW